MQAIDYKIEQLHDQINMLSSINDEIDQKIEDESESIADNARIAISETIDTIIFEAVGLDTDLDTSAIEDEMREEMQEKVRENV